MASGTGGGDYKESFFKMANSAFSASKVGWTRARQFTEEQMGSVEKTQYDAQFENELTKADRTKTVTEKLHRQTEAMLQPNPGVRIEEFMYEKLDKKNPARPTNAFVLGQTMLDASQDVGPGTSYGVALSKVGSSMKKIGNAEKDFMQKSMSQYLQPLRGFLDVEMKTITKERRALEVKRLDLDACKNKVKKAASAEKMREAEGELRVVQSEFDQQQEVTKLLLNGMSTTHANHLSSLQRFVDGMEMYHAQCQQYLTELQKELKQTSMTAPVRPTAPSAPPSYSPTAPLGHGKPSVTRRAKVLYDYDAANATELSLLAEEIVTVYSVEGLDSDWIIAERGSQSGKVPIHFLELI